MKKEDWLDRTLNKFSPRMQIAVWASCLLIAIPLLFVLLNPEGGSIVLTFVGFMFYDRVAKFFPEDPKRPITLIKIGLIGFTIFVITTAVLWLLFIPICHWIEVQETIDIRFLNNEIYYGLSLCYAGEVDTLTLGFGAAAHYILVPLFYLGYQLLALPFRLFRQRSS